ncbi:hypothetical protein PTTG_10138, partial [Puccinia triticina 1-1 BBBD Race 1]|uniref:Reverse transcriptase domain-containing protein n=1 Tax=Puccinia triticina (isolate 1-1 / race 1 (BBBD)) TaxID=630390 RepID=A0A0C4FA97_PUCT1
WESTYGLMEKYGDLLTGFEFAFDQGIPDHFIKGMPFFTPDNHASLENVRSKVKDSIAKELLAGRMFGPFTQEEVHASDGAIRPINDLSYPRNNTNTKSVNSFVNKKDFNTTWDNFNTVSKFFTEEKRQVELALFDWEKAYRQIPTKMRQWRYLMVKDFHGRFLLDTQITFGGVAGCGSFGRPADAWKEIMRSHFDLITIFRWVNNNLFVRSLGSTTDMKDVVAKSKELGVLTNEKKFSSFLVEQKFIGFVWNGIEKTVRLPDGKIEKRISQLLLFLNKKEKFGYKQ